MRTHHITHAGQAQDQPGAFAGGIHTEGDDPGWQFLACDIITRHIVGIFAGPVSDCQHYNQI
jgi:hypothetical protein